MSKGMMSKKKYKNRVVILGKTPSNKLYFSDKSPLYDEIKREARRKYWSTFRYDRLILIILGILCILKIISFLF